MKFRKIALAGFILPVFAMSVGCANKANRISFKEALDFTRKYYDPHINDGAPTTYYLKINTLALKNIKLYERKYTNEGEVILDTYHFDVDIHNLTINLNPNKIPLPHITSNDVTQGMQVLSYLDASLGYFDAGFTLDGKKLGVEVLANDNKTVANLLGVLVPNLPNMGSVFKKIIPARIARFFTYVSAVNVTGADIGLDFLCNKIGFLTNANLNLSLDTLTALASKKAAQHTAIVAITSDYVDVDLSFVAEY